MFEQIKGIQYYAFEGSDVGVMWLEPCDLIEVENAEESTYKTIYLKANITINTGISSDIEAEVPEATNTEYKVTTKEEKKTLKVERLAKKNEGLIQDLIQETTEQGQKLTEVEQTVDGITQTVSSVETKIETVEDKADNAQNTADSATQKAENAQTSANNAQSTANTANTNAQNAQKTADGAVTQITTTNQKVSKIDQTVRGITQSVSEVEEKVETVESKADTAQSTANTANQNVEEVKKQGADKVIAVKFSSDDIDNSSSMMDLVMKTIDIMGSKIAEANIAQSDICINIKTEKMGLLDTEKVEECYNYGYKAANENMEKILEKLYWQT